MYSIEKLEKILNEKVYSIEETSYGVTNNNYIVTTCLLYTSDVADE